MIIAYLLAAVVWSAIAYFAIVWRWPRIKSVLKPDSEELPLAQVAWQFIQMWLICGLLLICFGAWLNFFSVLS